MKNIKLWLLGKKQEMTRVWVWENLEPITLVKIPAQTVLRHKTLAVDGYFAIVVELDGWKRFEYACDSLLLEKMPVWFSCWLDMLADVWSVRLVWVSKGKWFQWGMKRHNFGWWPATHGSKFHRALWSTGNRKPRRTIKWQKMAWRMGWDTITLKSVPVLWLHNIDGVQLVAIKWSIPGAYNDYIKLIVM